MTDTQADDGTASGHLVPFISRVRLKNYRSIAECDVRLGPLTILVGPNGSGKSNFLDALAFLARAVQTSVAEAVDTRGGMREILRRVPSHTRSVEIVVESTAAEYLVEIGSRAEIIREELTTSDGVHLVNDDPDRRRPLLTLLRGMEQFWFQLSQMQFYNFEAETLRRPEAPSATGRLGSAGEYVGDVLAAMPGESRERLDAYLRAIEEPETALHPAAAGALFDALTEASLHVQVLAATQSADLLDREDLDVSTIRPVTMRDGLSAIGEVDRPSREIVGKHLHTLGELMRGNQLESAPADGHE